MFSYNRLIFNKFLARLQEPRHFIQVLAGPRQVGKTTMVLQALEKISIAKHYASADEPALKNLVWVEVQWQAARNLLLQTESKSQTKEVLLVLDEIQKIPNWSEVVKKLWDEDTRYGRMVKVVLLGSAPLLIQRGLTETLAGRFEKTLLLHWSFAEMREAFAWNLEQYIFFGGYPGSVPLVQDQARFKQYILDSLIETSIARDILLMTRVDKPALLRQLFQLGCNYSGQIVALQKILGQLHDAGNATTLAHYLELLGVAGMLTGIQKYSCRQVKKRASSPKFQVLNNALMSVSQPLDFAAAKAKHNFWGRLVESAAGVHLLNQAATNNVEVYYWRERNLEVDFVLRLGEELVAFEIKSQIAKDNLPGLQAFANKFKTKALFQIGGAGIPLEDFFLAPITHWFN